jgi:hypothetical protein
MMRRTGSGLNTLGSGRAQDLYSGLGLSYLCAYLCKSGSGTGFCYISRNVRPAGLAQSLRSIYKTNKNPVARCCWTSRDVTRRHATSRDNDRIFPIVSRNVSRHRGASKCRIFVYRANTRRLHTPILTRLLSPVPCTRCWC